MVPRSSTSSPRSEVLAALGVAVSAALVALAAACTAPPPSGPPPSTTATTTTSTPSGTGPPVISGFAPTHSGGSAPLTTAFWWSVTDPDQDPLTCGLDFDDDGVYEVTESSCTSDSTRAATFGPGEHPVHLRVSDGTSTVVATSTVVVGPTSPDGFGITVRFHGSLSPTQQAAFDGAAERWSEVVRTGLSDVHLSLSADECGTGAPAFEGVVDDLLIDAGVVPIDGPGGVLAQAGPCLVRTGGGLPAYGVMGFDTADMADLEASGQLETVILHEMGHVLGIGTVWGSLLSGAGTSDPVFTGPAARGAWDALHGGWGISVPVENAGGPGTADAHWRESVFGNELMTGYLDAGANPLSTVTVGSLADIGYGVDLAAADQFGTADAMRRARPVHRIRTILVRPRGSVPG